MAYLSLVIYGVDLVVGHIQYLQAWQAEKGQAQNLEGIVAQCQLERNTDKDNNHIERVMANLEYEKW